MIEYRQTVNAKLGVAFLLADTVILFCLYISLFNIIFESMAFFLKSVFFLMLFIFLYLAVINLRTIGIDKEGVKLYGIHHSRRPVKTITWHEVKEVGVVSGRRYGSMAANEFYFYVTNKKLTEVQRSMIPRGGRIYLGKKGMMSVYNKELRDVVNRYYHGKWIKTKIRPDDDI